MIYMNKMSMQVSLRLNMSINNHFHPASTLTFDAFPNYLCLRSLLIPSWVSLPSSRFLLLFLVRERVDPFFLNTSEAAPFC